MSVEADQALPHHRSRLVTLVTCIGLLISAAPRSAVAAPEPEPAPSSSSEAEAIFRRGQAKYETADYSGAIELWTEAYALVDPTPENASIKALLIYNLAQAHIKAYELDDDPIHLKQAQQLLESFKANLGMLYDDGAQFDEEQAKVDERLAEIAEKIAAREQAEAEAEPKPEPEPPPPVVQPDDTQTDRVVKPGTPLVIAGGVVTGLGALSGIGAIVGGLIASSANDISDLDPTDLQGREDRFAAGQAGNAMVVVGSIGAGVLVPTGVALIVVGALRNKKAKRKTAALPLLTPTLGQGAAGLTLSGRF